MTESNVVRGHLKGYSELLYTAKSWLSNLTQKKFISDLTPIHKHFKFPSLPFFLVKICNSESFQQKQQDDEDT